MATTRTRFTRCVALYAIASVTFACSTGSEPESVGSEIMPATSPVVNEDIVTAPALPTSAPADPEPNTTDSTASTSSTTTTTTAIESPEVRIEDVLLELNEVGDRSVQRGLLPPGSDELPFVDSPVPATPGGACAFDRSTTRYNVVIRACELADSAEAAEQATLWSDFLAADQVARFGREYIRVESIEHAGWVGSRIEAPSESRNDNIIIELYRQDGLRSFQISVADFDDNNLRADVIALADAQDTAIEEVIDDESIPAGFADQAERLTVDDVLLTWSALEELGGAPMVGVDTEYLSGSQRVGLGESGHREADFGSGRIRLSADRWADPDTAALALGRPGAVGSDRIITTVHGDRTYRIEVIGEVPGNADGLLAQRTSVALDEYLATLDLTGPTGDIPEQLSTAPDLATTAPLTAVLPSTADFVGIESTLLTSRFDAAVAASGISPEEAEEFLGAASWSQDREEVDGDAPWTEAFASYGLNLGFLSGTSAQVFGLRVFDGRLTESLPTWIVENTIPNQWATAENPQGRTVSVRRFGDVGLVLIPFLGETQADERATLDLLESERDLSAMIVEQRTESVRPADEEHVGWQNVLRNLTEPSVALTVELDSPVGSTRTAIGGRGGRNAVGPVTSKSPAGALGEWSATYGVDPTTAPAGPSGERRVVLFGSSAEAEQFVLDRIGPLPVQTEPGLSAGGFIEEGGTASLVTTLGPWALVFTNSKGIGSFDGIDFTSLDRLRPDALRWVDDAYMSGLR